MMKLMLLNHQSHRLFFLLNHLNTFECVPKSMIYIIKNKFIYKTQELAGILYKT